MHVHTPCIHRARTTRTRCMCRACTTRTPCTHHAPAPGVRDDRYWLHASDGGPAWSHASSRQRQRLATCSPRQPGVVLLAHGNPLDPELRRPSAPPSPPALAAPSALSARSPPPLLPPTPPPLSTGGPRGYDASKPADGNPAAPRVRPIGRLRCGRHARAAWSHCGACSQHGSTALHPWSTVTRAVQRLYGLRSSAGPESPVSSPLVLRAPAYVS